MERMDEWPDDVEGYLAMASQVGDITDSGDGILFRKGKSETPGLDLKVNQLDKGC